MLFGGGSLQPFIALFLAAGNSFTYQYSCPPWAILFIACVLPTGNGTTFITKQ